MAVAILSALKVKYKSYRIWRTKMSTGHFAGAACKTPSPRISTTSGQGYIVHRCYSNGLTYQPALPFSQKSFDKQNIFGSPKNTWCPRCVFYTHKSTKTPIFSEKSLKSGHFLRLFALKGWFGVKFGVKNRCATPYKVGNCTLLISVFINSSKKCV